MERTQVKICGIFQPDILPALTSKPIDYLGFVFAPSKRQITPELFSQMDLSRIFAKTVGVFVNPTLDEIEQAISANRLDFIQLHGDETPEFCIQVKQKWNKSVIKAIRTSQYEWIKSHKVFYDILLLDSSTPQQFGGLGVAFDWSIIPRFQDLCKLKGVPIWVAGGVNPGNVTELIENYRPDAVDCSSGVESEGKKNITKIDRLLENIKRTAP